MKMLSAFGEALMIHLILLLLPACGTAVPADPRPAVVAEELTRAPSACGDGGACPTGQGCGDTGICGDICGDGTVVCPPGFYCSKRSGGGTGYGYPWNDCVPACLRFDGVCP